MDKSNNKIVSLFRGSFIFSVLSRFADFLYKKGQRGVVGGALTAYNAENKAFRKGWFSAVAAKFSFSKKLKHSIAKKTEESVTLSVFDTFFRRLAGLSMRFYGVLAICFGIAGGAVSLLKALTEAEVEKASSEFPEVELFCLALVAAVGLLALISKKSFADELLENRLMSFLCFDVIGARRSAFEEIERVKGSKLLAAIIGLALGFASYVVPPVLIIAAFFGIIALYAVLVIPEFGVVASIFALSFLPTMVLVAMIAYTFMCYVFKLLRGKRTFRFSLMDAAVLVFMIFMAAGGVFSVGESLKPALVYCCFMLGYFLAVNLLRSEIWIKRSVYAIVVSASLVALYGIYENYFGSLLTIWQDENMFGDISGRVISTFGNPNVLGEYLLMAIPFVLAMLIISRKRSGKAASFMLFCVCCLCLIYTWSRGAWLGFIFEIAFFLLVSTSKSLVLGFFGIASLPFLPLVLPENIVNRITSIGNLGDSSTSYRVHIWEAVVKMAEDFKLSGIGIGSDAFTKVYPKYSLSGIEKAPHAHNLFLQIWIELGLPGLIVFFAVVLLFLQSAFTFYKNGTGKKMKDGKFLSLAGLCGILGVLLQGLTDYIWYNYRVYLMFWLVIGIVIASQNFYIEEARCEIKSEI